MGVQTAPASTLSELIGLVERAFSILGDGTPIMVGEQYRRDPGPGSPPRILFVPDQQPGTLAGSHEIGAGYSAAWRNRCAVYVRAAETGEDTSRLEPTYRLAGRAIDVLKNLGPGNVEVAPGGPREVSPMQVDGPAGAEVVFTFSFRFDVPTDPRVLLAIAELTAVSPVDPMRPEGDTGNTFTVAPTATPERI